MPLETDSTCTPGGRTRSFLHCLLTRPEGISADEHVEQLARMSDGRAEREELVAYFAALSSRTPFPQEVIAFARYVGVTWAPKVLSVSSRAVNIVGTGGGRETFNISTTAAIIAAGAGATVIKTGSAAHSSQCGSLDVLGALGLKPLGDFQQVDRMANEVGVAFVSPRLYAPFLRRIAVSMHPLTLHDIGAFVNRVGPLLCPVQVAGTLVGVGSTDWVPGLAAGLSDSGAKGAVLAWADDGVDELCSVVTSYLFDVRSGRTELLDPVALGFSRGPTSALAGGDRSQNAATILGVLRGTIRDVRRDTAALNAACLLRLAGRAFDIPTGLKLAFDAIDAGRAIECLERAIAFASDVEHQNAAAVMQNTASGDYHGTCSQR